MAAGNVAGLFSEGGGTAVVETEADFVEMLPRLHFSMLDIVYVDDTDPARKSLGASKNSAQRFIEATQNQAKLCTTFDPV